MENNSLFPLKYRLRKTDELVEIVAWETTVKGARIEKDWVPYIDSQGNEHIMERLTLEWDFVIQTPFEKGFLDALKPDDLVNIETDLVGKYVCEQLRLMDTAPRGGRKLSMDDLTEAGF